MSFRVPSTALLFFDDFVISGSGPNAHVHSLDDGVVVQKEPVLPRGVVHGIRRGSGVEKASLVFFGQKCFQFALLHETVTKVGKPCYLDDWILDVHFFINSSFLAIATAHNSVYTCNIESREITKLRDCEVQSILYSFRFAELDVLTGACGTVFNQILLWKPFKGSKIVARAKGHKGVIFSIQFDLKGNRMCSVSDDRTVRIWDLSLAFAKHSRSTSEIAHLPQLSVLFGHTARVWDAQFLTTNRLISIGEDSTCRMWDLNLHRCTKVYKGHKGRSIWSLAFHRKRGIAVTGGGDSSIRLWPLDLDETGQFEAHILLGQLPSERCSPKDFPRSLKQIDSSRVLVLTHEGFLFLFHVDCEGDFSSSDWTFLDFDADFSGYSVVDVSKEKELIAIGNLGGKIKILTLEGKVIVHLRGFEGKVFSLLWATNEEQHDDEVSSSLYLFSCGPDGKMICWAVDDSGTAAIRFATLLLPPCKHRWLTTVKFVGSSQKHSSTSFLLTIVCGDRSGSLHVFTMEKRDLGDGEAAKMIIEKPEQTFRCIHGKHGVSDIVERRQNGDGGNRFILSCGRNGVWRKYSWNGNRLEIVTENTIKGMDWIERLIFVNDDHDDNHHHHQLFVSGFHSSYFVVWALDSNETLLSWDCGGAHRSWDMSMDWEKGLVVFTYIRNCRINFVYQKMWRQVSSTLLQPSFHGREATCLSLLWSHEQTGEKALLLSGSEDCEIKVWKVDRSDHFQFRFEEMATCKGHTSSVKCLALSHNLRRRRRRRIDGDGSSATYLLFSGGGRDSLKAWLISTNDGDDDDDVVKSVSCHEIASLNAEGRRRRRRRRPSAEDDGFSAAAARCMALTTFFVDLKHFVISGWSNGLIKFHLFSEASRQFSVALESIPYGRCLLAIDHLIVKNGDKCLLLLFTSSTDGCISLWNCTCLLGGRGGSGGGDDDDEPPQQKQPIILHRFSAHQSGVNDFAVQYRKNSDDYLLVSGGDDNALYAATFRLNLSSPLAILPTAHCLEANAHISSITGVAFGGSALVFSTSADQRIKKWRIERCEWKLEKEIVTSIADISSLITWKAAANAGNIVAVCGIGMEIVREENEEKTADDSMQCAL